MAHDALKHTDGAIGAPDASSQSMGQLDGHHVAIQSAAGSVRTSIPPGHGTQAPIPASIVVQGDAQSSVQSAAPVSDGVVVMPRKSGAAENGIVDFAELRIALVDDEPANQRVAVRFLKLLGVPAANIIIFSDGMNGAHSIWTNGFQVSPISISFE